MDSVSSPPLFETTIVAIHGMGDQKKNSTVLPVIRLLHSANLTLANLDIDSRPARLISHSDCEKIPKGRAYYDFHWAKLLEDGHQRAGQSMVTFAKTLTERVKKRNSPSLVYLLQTLTHLTFCADGLMKLKLPWLSELVFERYLGDVQIYAESPQVRQLAQEKLASELCLIASQSESITLIAHSLGSVLAFDTLLAAALSDSPPKWLDQINYFVSLGSPITKFTTLWPEHYPFKSNKVEAKEESTEEQPKPTVKKRENPIFHINYADENDPAGHFVASLKNHPEYNAVFELKEDIVFSRYWKPGWAHTKYFNDFHLIKRIDSFLNPKAELHPLATNQRYYRVAFIRFGCYLIINAAISAIIIGNCELESWQSRIFAAPVSLLGMLITILSFVLLIQWQLIIYSQSNENSPHRLSKSESALLKAAQERRTRVIGWSIFFNIVMGFLNLLIFTQYGLFERLQDWTRVPGAVGFLIDLALIFFLIRHKLSRAAPEPQDVATKPSSEKQKENDDRPTTTKS